MSLPLRGLKILDFSTLLPGPYATQILADMGAKVLRVESPTRPDIVKIMPPMVGKVSAAHASVNRNKESIAIDLQKPEAKAVVLRFLDEYDIVLEQFRPGVMERLGLSYEDLKPTREDLIYCSITGYGQTGPYKDRAGHDMNYLALSGLASYSGRQDTGPVLSGTQIADIAGGSHHAVMAILAAFIQRIQTGEGAYLDISMCDAALSMHTIVGAGALVSGKDPQAGCEMLNGGWFYDYYQTADDRYLSIGGLEPKFASGMLSQLGLQNYLNKIADTRPEVQAQLRAVIAEKVKQQPLAHWLAVFEKEDVCVEPVLNFSEAVDHPHFQAREMFCEAEDNQGNRIRQINTALPFKRKQAHCAGAELGAQTLHILARFGFSENEISELKEQQVIK